MVLFSLYYIQVEKILVVKYLFDFLRKGILPRFSYPITLSPANPTLQPQALLERGLKLQETLAY